MKFLKPLLLILAAAVVSVAVNSDPVRATFYKWSQTAASDANADSTINWAEGMAPSAVNDSARAMMAALAKYRDDTSGKLVLGGTSTAYTVSSNQVFNSLANMDGQELTFRIPAGTTSGAAPTLNVDGLGAKALNQASSVAVATGALTAGAAYSAVYLNATSEWIVRGISGGLPSGSVVLMPASACPTGWTAGGAGGFNDGIVKVVSSGGGSTLGSVLASTLFGRTATDGTALLQTHLPIYDFFTGSLGISVGGTITYDKATGVAGGGFSGGGAAATTPLTQTPTAATNGVTASLTGTIGTSGGNTAHTHPIDMRVFQLTTLACTKN